MTRNLTLALSFFLSALALHAGPKCEAAKSYLSGQEVAIKEMSEKKPSGRHGQSAIDRFKKDVADLKIETEKASGQDEKKCERLMKAVKRKLGHKDGGKKGRHKGHRGR